MFTTIRLQHFRSYADESIELGSGVSIVVGPNASGKTNLLESLLVLARGKSYRASDEELVQFKKSWARLDGQLDDGSTRTVKLEQDPSGKTLKSYIIDELPYVRLTHNRQLPVVLFEPEHLRLLHGSPESRRNFLDDLLEQSDTGFSTVRNHYKRALAQRNSLLKQSNHRNDQLFVWNLRLSELGAYIADARRQLIDTINDSIPKIYSGIAGKKSKVEVVYKSSIESKSYSTGLLKKLEASVHQDMMRGFTSYGPHRDDFIVLLNSHPVSSSASRGETRSLLLSLKVIETRVTEQVHGRKPLLLLDDVFSELDGARRHALTKIVDGYQTIITTTDADAVVEHFLDSEYQIIPTTKV